MARYIPQRPKPYPETLVPGAGAFWDASRGLILAGSDVVTVADQALGGVADTATGAAGSEPQYVANSGGYPAFDFAGANYFECADSADFSLSATGCTIGCWVNLDDNAGYYGIFSQYNPQRIYFRVNQTTGQLYTEFANVGTASSVGPAVAGWHHLATVYDGTLAAANRCVHYIDGVAQATTCSGVPATLPDVASDVLIGAQHAGATRVFLMNGLMDDIGYWNRALTAAEVALLASMRA